MDLTPTAAEASAEATERLARLRERLRGATGERYWRSLEELSDTPEFQELVQREFPSALPVDETPTSRRRFLQLMGASLALAGLNACGRQPLEKLVPYVKQPEEIIPGMPLYFASSMPQAGSGLAMGVLVESHMGRPTKIEGNPEHPASRGGTDLYTQASVLDLYDPDRSQIVSHYGDPRSWDSFCAANAEILAAHRALGGEGMAVLTPSMVSPTHRRLMDELQAAMPRARFVQWEAAGRDPVHRATSEAFGRALDPVYDFSEAQVVLALDSDFLTQGPGAVRAARDFMEKRRVRGGHAEMNRLYAVESTPTNTGTVADHRWALSPRELERFALAVAAELGVAGARAKAPFDSGEWSHRIEEVAKDLSRRRGSCLVVAGECAPVPLQVLAHAMNQALGNVGRTVRYLDLGASDLDPNSQLRELVTEIDAGRIDLCFLLGVNPVFDAPGDVDLGAALMKVEHCVHLGLHADETSQYCPWHIPEKHWLEAFGDALAFDGTVSLAQPLLEPLYQGKSLSQFLRYLLDGEIEVSDEEIVQDTWRARWGQDGLDRRWRKSLHDGVIEGESAEAFASPLRSRAASQAASLLGGGEGLSVLFRADPTIFDGRLANNGWLQECPKPLTRLTWDNAALIAPALAEAQGLANDDVVEISVDGRSVEIPVWIVPGHAPDCITLNFGYGRTHGGHVALGTGTDVYPLRSSLSPWRLDGASLRRTGHKSPLATTQEHHSMEGRALVRSGTLEEYHHDPEHIVHGPEGHLDVSKSLYPSWDYSEGYKWGLAIDLTSCTGCNACVMACVAENNIAVVGKEQVLNGREMQWIRIDRYFVGDLDEANAVNQPVMCMHCEQAPCEPVCPVGATVHSAEGLNDMVYNRCVGTRYCSNNCPYKVRRFNFLSYGNNKSETLKMQRNPDVTVRMRGVMEKCTYCVQRINSARIEAKKEERSIRDGEIVTACQQACPAQAIAFGDLNDERSQVSRWKSEPTDYGMLTELGTRPRTSYLAKLRNPNPELETSQHG